MCEEIGQVPQRNFQQSRRAQMIGRRRLRLGVPYWLYLVVLIPFLAPFGPAAAATEAILPSLSPVLERVSPGVVNISVRSTQQMRSEEHTSECQSLMRI